MKQRIRILLLALLVTSAICGINAAPPVFADGDPDEIVERPQGERPDTDPQGPDMSPDGGSLSDEEGLGEPDEIIEFLGTSAESRATGVMRVIVQIARYVVNAPF